MCMEIQMSNCSAFRGINLVLIQLDVWLTKERLENDEKKKIIHQNEPRTKIAIKKTFSILINNQIDN